MSAYPISIRPYGVHAILVEWPKKVAEDILDDILQYIRHLEAHCLEKDAWELIPAYNSLTLVHRAKPIHFDRFGQQLQHWYSEKGNTPLPPKNLWRLPVCYDPGFGIDLDLVSQKLGMDADEIVALHTEHTYTVYGLGFLPGFMYLGGLPESLEIPRRPEPRPRVPKGSVGLAGKQTGIYPQQSPGGWNIIGNCPIPMFDIRKEEPCFVSVGDKVRFHEIEKAEHELHKIEGEVGIYELQKERWDG